MSARRHIHWAALVAVVAAIGAAHAGTIATFADPAADGSTPLFTFDGTSLTLTGGWSGNDLLLQTPGLAAPDFPNAKFTMTPLSLVPLYPGLYLASSGSIQFFDAASDPIFRIDFGSALLNASLSFGASDFTGQNVTFSGSAITTPLSQEAFAFSFANPAATANGFTVTSSFTSSAVPEPSALPLAVCGLAGLLLRRR